MCVCIHRYTQFTDVAMDRETQVSGPFVGYPSSAEKICIRYRY